MMEYYHMTGRILIQRILRAYFTGFVSRTVPEDNLGWLRVLDNNIGRSNLNDNPKAEE